MMRQIRVRYPISYMTHVVIVTWKLIARFRTIHSHFRSIHPHKHTSEVFSIAVSQKRLFTRTVFFFGNPYSLSSMATVEKFRFLQQQKMKFI